MPDALAVPLGIVIVLFGGPLIICVCGWLSDNGKAKRLLAQARLQESKNAASQETRHGEG